MNLWCEKYKPTDLHSIIIDPNNRKNLWEICKKKLQKLQIKKGNKKRIKSLIFFLFCVNI